MRIFITSSEPYKEILPESPKVSSSNLGFGSYEGIQFPDADFREYPIISVLDNINDT
jgi:hypothetical protein